MINVRDEPVVMDFGLARRLSADGTRLTADGSAMGTPAYMAPEQARGDLAAMGPACDTYSLGVMLYELLAGRLPFRGNQAGVGPGSPPDLTTVNLPPRTRRRTGVTVPDGDGQGTATAPRVGGGPGHCSGRLGRDGPAGAPVPAAAGAGHSGRQRFRAAPRGRRRHVHHRHARLPRRSSPRPPPPCCQPAPPRAASSCGARPPRSGSSLPWPAASSGSASGREVPSIRRVTGRFPQFQKRVWMSANRCGSFGR